MVAQQRHSANARQPELRPLRLGTRGSPLALVQAAEVVRRLVAANPDLDGARIETVVVRTSGDRIQDRPLAEVGGKGLFAKEIEDLLLAGDLDFAVHSAKDLETRLPEGLEIGCVLPREDPRDVLLCATARTIETLPHGACVGTASLRRGAQLLHRRPDLKIVTLRGNVETRLQKLRDGAVDATLLALAGLKRLGRDEAMASVLDVAELLPAVGQGAIALECRANDAATRTRLATIDHPASATCLAAERAMLATLDGSCRTPIAGLAELDGDTLTLEGLVAMPDGSALHRSSRRAPASQGADLGAELGAELRRLAGPRLFEAW
ncbi:MAG: hydroxymethylbilane synthase [Proteobacteria bacterium]|nr:hydroxymethylbilane synthase [Pseudomonadota bacterium]